MDIEIKDGKDYLEEVKSLIAEYTQRLGRSLSFQNLEDELKDPSKKYSPPHYNNPMNDVLYMIKHLQRHCPRYVRKPCVGTWHDRAGRGEDGEDQRNETTKDK